MPVFSTPAGIYRREVKGFGLTEAYQLQDHAGQLAEPLHLVNGLSEIFVQSFADL